MALDGNLVSTWKPKGITSGFRTYRVDANGNYFVADPEAPISFDGTGLKLTWGGIGYTKKLGAPNAIPGVWDADSGGEEWYFRADGTVTVHFSATEEYFGNYETRNSGNALWYEEFRGLVSTDGDRVNFDPPYSADATYRYSVDSQFWTLFDLATSTPVFEYEKV